MSIKKILEENVLTMVIVSLVLLMPISAILMMPAPTVSDGSIMTDGQCGGSKSFTSDAELNQYVRTTSMDNRNILGQWGPVTMDGETTPTGGTTPVVPTSVPIDHSGTNIQVEGVDEPDIVKTDGRHLYVKSGNEIVILEAYPGSDAKIISRIGDVADWGTEMFLAGPRLVIFEGLYTWNETGTTVRIYDITQPSEPELVQEISLSGNYLDSRLIGGYAYVVTTQYALYRANAITLPVIENENTTRRVRASEVCYFDKSAPAYAFTLIASIDVLNGNVLYKVYLTDVSRLVYVSTENIYLTSMNYGFLAWDRENDRQTETTTIHKISIDEGRIEHTASGEVTGTILDQFSMDEYDGYFRVITTTNMWWRANDNGPGNNVYVLNSGLRTIGKLEGLATGEQLHSARFMGERCYLVTFRRIDPFFVIDLSNPTAPKVLGELLIPGVSDYLHPYDDNHIIGLGFDSDEQGRWMNGVKLSLFDVTDVSDPTEMSKYVVQNSWSSLATMDHKAFTFSRELGLLIIPVDGSSDPSAPWMEHDGYYQAAFVFSVTLDEGFQLRGTITHIEDQDEPWRSNVSLRRDITRSLYIEDEIYTVSESMVKISSLDDLSEIKAIEF